MNQTIVLATSNAGKLKEFQLLLADLPITLVSSSELQLSSPEETGLTFIENALIKARYATLHSGYPAIADDSGLSLMHLRGAPGIHSARFAGENASDEERNQKLLHLLGTEEAERRGYYTCAVVYLEHAEDPIPIIAQEHWHGTIVQHPQGANGFGYDPIFYIPEKACTVAQLSVEEKNRLSHRGRAMSALRKQLQLRWRR